jgi:hypothetical protein
LYVCVPEPSAICVRLPTLSGRPEQERPECALYVDEVQSYLTLPSPLADMLAEARGYHLSLCLAHQHLGQLPREMREALAANARTKLYFQLSLQDAHALARELEPELTAHDLANLPRHTAARRLRTRRAGAGGVARADRGRARARRGTARPPRTLEGTRVSAPPITAPPWAPTWAPPWAPVRTGAPMRPASAHEQPPRGRGPARDKPGESQ